VLSSQTLPKYSPKVWKTLTQWLHSKKEYKPEYLAEPEPRAAIEESSRILSAPLKELSVKQEIPAELTAALESNVFFFSGFKTHHELVEASKLLKDENGNFKPFNRFLKDVATIDDTYNRNYLNAEYNFATASSQMAVKWKEWEADGDDYDLQYRTAGDDRVRDEHASLNNTTLPPSDPFWKSYLPPNGWNCRCTTVQVRKGKYPKSDSEKAVAKGNAMTDTPKKQIFRFNPGAQEKIFPPKHPYYKAEDIVREALEKINLSKVSKETREYINNNIDKTISYSIDRGVKNKGTGVLRLDNGGIRSCLKSGSHSKSIESKWAFVKAIESPDKLKHLERAKLGKGKDKSNPSDLKNIKDKEKRGVTAYNYYEFIYNDKKWIIGLEVIKDEYEQPYFIALKKK